jgi:crotonobetainyl-CoA:carnitine CoA-transferase CaiB-like acyl-CoA transferase
MARGQVIDLSLLEAMYGVLGPEAGSWAVTGEVKERTGSASGNSAPRNVYKTRDGRWIAMSGSTERMAKRILLLVGGDALARDPRFATNADRVRNRVMLDAVIGEWIGARDRDVALATFRAEGITVGPVHDIADFMDDDHVIEREVVVSIPDHDLGSVPVHNVLPRLSATPGAIRHVAPEIGADAEAVLRQAGFSAAEIEALRAAGALG